MLDLYFVISSCYSWNNIIKIEPLESPHQRLSSHIFLVYFWNYYFIFPLRESTIGGLFSHAIFRFSCHGYHICNPLCMSYLVINFWRGLQNSSCCKITATAKVLSGCITNVCLFALSEAFIQRLKVVRWKTTKGEETKVLQLPSL